MRGHALKRPVQQPTQHREGKKYSTESEIFLLLVRFGGFFLFFFPMLWRETICMVIAHMFFSSAI